VWWWHASDFVALVLSGGDLAGNLLLDSVVTGLPKDSVAVPLGVELVDRSWLAGQLPRALVDAIDDGLRAVLGL
jgi:hypothetical protein